MAKYMTEYIDKEKAIYLVEKAVSKADAMNALRELKAADVVPVRHGKWERTDCGLDVECKCSVCGYKDFVPHHDNYWFKRNFCPNCGARMDGGQDDKG